MRYSMEVSFILDTGLRLLLLNTGIHSLVSFLRIPQKLGNLYQISSYEFRGWKDCIVFSINSRKRKKSSRFYSYTLTTYDDFNKSAEEKNYKGHI